MYVDKYYVILYMYINIYIYAKDIVRWHCTELEEPYMIHEKDDIQSDNVQLL